MEQEPVEFVAKSESEIVSAYTQGSFTTIPSAKVVFLRRCFLWQLIRFIMINIRMTIMILKSHK